MEDVKRGTRMLVVADSSGKIISATWPGVESEGAPTESGVSLEANQVVHEVDIPDDVVEAAKPDLSGYRIRSKDRGPSLVRGDE